jgi:hypothetical protein
VAEPSLKLCVGRNADGWQLDDWLLRLDNQYEWVFSCECSSPMFPIPVLIVVLRLNVNCPA